MKGLVIHGDYIVKSYGRLQALITDSKKKGWQIERVLDNKKSALSEKLTAKNLFATKVLYVVEDFNKLGKKDLLWLKKNADSLESFLLIYSSSILTKTAINKLPKEFKSEVFSLPKYIWKFYDSFYPGNAKYCLELLHEVIKNEPLEFVFSLLARHIRDVYWAGIDAAKIPYPSWRVEKLKTQAKRFTIVQLEKIINELSQADIKAKTSKANLIDSLDFIIATHLI